MTHCLSRSLYTSPLTSVPITLLSSRLSHLRSSFLPRGGALRTGVSCSWNLEKRCNRFAVKCDATVAEKETTEEGSGEKFEYQAENFSLHLKRISGVPNQQAIMAYSDLHILQMSSSLNGLDGYHHRPIHVGSSQFHGGAAAMRLFPSNGILGQLNTPSRIGDCNLSSPPLGMFFQNQYDLRKFDHVSALRLSNNDGGNNLKEFPMRVRSASIKQQQPRH